MNDHAGFLAAIIAEPDDDALRLILIYADWLEEQGNEARAEFIRVQCELARMGNPFSEADDSKYDILRRREWELLSEHWTEWYPKIGWHSGTLVCSNLNYGRTIGYPAITFRHGFVAKVHCTLADWMGGECGFCHGNQVGQMSAGGMHRIIDCPTCHGTGRVGGHGPTIVQAAPIERVVTEKRPVKVDEDDWIWSCAQQEIGEHHEDANHWIPENLYALVSGNSDSVYRGYSTEQAALDALSAALITHAKNVNFARCGRK